MFGKLISSAIRIATLPVDAASAGMDIITGGNCSKRSRTAEDNPNPFAIIETLRDRVAEAAEDIDE